MVNVVLMAGSGKRFSDAGYTIPKPLLPVLGKPMILQAVQCMPPADRWVFVIREEYLKEEELLETLKSVASNTTVLVDPNPIGQLKSCLVAREHYDADETVFVGACDFGMTYDLSAYQRLIDPHNPTRPSIVSWSFTGQQNLVRNPKAWGWLKQDAGGTISGVSVKVPISDDPLHDYAITGSFTFKSGKDFLTIAEELMRRDIRVNGEFYIDSMLGLGIELGYTAQSFTVTYVGWGTPSDYEEYLQNTKGNQ